MADPTSLTSQQNALLGDLRSALDTSPAFLALPRERRNAMSQGLGRILTYVTDAPDKPPALAHAQRTPRAPRGPRAGQVTGNATRHGTAAMKRLVRDVDFPKFVSGLIDGVFTSIVDSSIKQMEAYSAMVEAVARSTDDFARENISDAAAREYVADSFPGAIDITADDDGPLLAMRDGMDGDGMPDFAAFLGVGEEDKPANVDDRESEAELVRRAKLKMARTRQQQLATMVLLGINRIVVTNGQINAKVVFDVESEESADDSRDTSYTDTDTAARSDGSTTDYSRSREGDNNSGRVNWDRDGNSGRVSAYSEKGKVKRGFGYKANRSRMRTRVRTVNANTDRSRSEELTARANLTGEVRLNFRSETFPLERIADQGGLALLQERAQPEPIAQATTVGAGRGAPALAPAEPT